MPKLDDDLARAFERYVPDIDRRATLERLSERRTRAARTRRVATTSASILVVAAFIGLVLGIRSLFQPEPQVMQRPVTAVLPGAPNAGVQIGDRLWAVTDHAAVEVDATSGRILATIPVPQASDIASAAGSLWVTSTSTNRVFRIDPATATVIARIALPSPGDVHMTGNIGIGPDFQPELIAGDGSGIWVVGSRRAIDRIDPATNEVVSTRFVPGLTQDIAVGHGQVWLAQDRWGLIRLDPSSGDIVERRPIQLSHGRSVFVFSVAITPDHVVASGENGRLHLGHDGTRWKYLPGCSLIVAGVTPGSTTTSPAPGCELAPAGDVAYMQYPGRRLVRVDLGTGATSPPVTFNGRYVFAASGDTVWISDGASGAVRSMAFSTAPIYTPPPPATVSPVTGPHPDGQLLVVKGNSRLAFVNGDGTGLRGFPAPAYGKLSPDGKEVVVSEGLGTGASQISIYDLLSGKLVERLPIDNYLDAQSPSWSPDGTDIIFNTGSVALEVFPLPDGPLQKVRMGAVRGEEPAWSPGGGLMAFVNDRSSAQKSGNLMVVATTGGTPRLVVDLPQPVGAPSWSPDGAHLVFSSQVHGVSQLFTVDAGGSHLAQITHGSMDATDPSWSPDGAWIAYTEDLGNASTVSAVHPDGSGHVVITNELKGASQPQWFPPHWGSQ